MYVKVVKILILNKQQSWYPDVGYSTYLLAPSEISYTVCTTTLLIF